MASEYKLGIVVMLDELPSDVRQITTPLLSYADKEGGRGVRLVVRTLP